jgi:sodium-dependent dicarboxylate transporter 2/3/5
MNQKKLFIAIAIALVATFMASFILDSLQKIVLVGIITLLVGLWSNVALPLGVVSLLPIILFPAFGILDTKATAINYANPIIFLFLGGFFLAIGVEKTKLHVYIAEKILSVFPKTPKGMIFSLALTSGLLSSVLSNTTTTLLLISIAIFLTDHTGLKMRFALAVAYGANIGGILTPIGTPPNLVLLGFMEEVGLRSIPFFSWVILVAPLVFVMLFVVSALLSIGTKEITIQRKSETFVLDANQKKVLGLMFGLIALLVVNARLEPFWGGLGLSESAILLGAGLLLFMPPFNVLVWEEDFHKVPYAIIFLFGAGFSIAKAFAASGLADDIATLLLGMTHLTPFLLLFGVAVLVTFATEITSNTALISIMLPVLYAVSQKSGLDPRLFMMVATLCASYAFMLPIATPPNAIAMSSGAVKIGDMVRYGIVLNIVGIVLIVLIAYFYWRVVI